MGVDFSNLGLCEIGMFRDLHSSMGGIRNSFKPKEAEEGRAYDGVRETVGNRESLCSHSGEQKSKSQFHVVLSRDASVV